MVVLVTCGAGLKLTLPAWLYWTVQVPVLLVMVKTAPTLVQDPTALYVTGNPDDAVAATVKLLPNTALTGAGIVTLIV